jgi:serpin B
MNTQHRQLFMTALLGAAMACGGINPQPVKAQAAIDANTLAAENAAFACDLYRQLAAAEGNLFFSPYSISSALAMTYAGARGETAAQMAATLRFSPAPEALHPAFAALAERLNAMQAPMETQAGENKRRLTVRIANSLWPQQGFALLPEFLDLNRRFYGATVTPLDYAGSGEAARATINRWVEDMTEAKIKNLVPEGALDARTRLVLVNAVYFLGDWHAPFDERQTREAAFRMGDTRTVQARLMYQRRQFRYADLDRLQILQMDYAGGGLSMLVLLPKAVDGGTETIAGMLNAENLKSWREALASAEVDVFFPTFRMESAFQLEKTLPAMGMSDAFSAARADFSGMNGRRDLFIGAALHKAFVDVKEWGTEAAAATAIGMRVTAARPTQPALFRADHPFVFLIQDNETGSVLFMGRVADPTAGGADPS